MSGQRRWIAWGAGAGSVGTATAATAAAACCLPVVAPLLVGVLGVSGSIWAASLEPWAPLLLAISGLLLGGGFWSLRSHRPRGDRYHACARGRRRHGPAALLLWIGAVLWAVALVLNILARWPSLLGG